MYECFHCCTKGVIWDSDFDFEDFGYDGGGYRSYLPLRELRSRDRVPYPVREFRG